MLTRIKLTLKQHRFETIATVVLCLIAAGASFVEVYRLNSIQLPAGCTVGPRYMLSADSSAIATSCQLAIDRFNAIAWGADMGLVRTLLVLLPFVVGILFGAPLVAKEIEQGTAPLSWALVGSRRRWLLRKMFTAALLIVPLLLLAGLAADVLQGAQTPGTDPHASFENFSFRGVMIVFWGLAALLGTVALGTLLGRTLPAVLVALVLCFLARGFCEPWLNFTVLPPLAVMQNQDIQNNQSGWSPNDLYVYYRTYLDGKPWDGDLNAWWNAHQPAMIVDPSGGIQPDPNAPAFDPAQVPQQIPFLISGSQYWFIVALESGILFLGSLFCGAVALIWVDRR